MIVRFENPFLFFEYSIFLKALIGSLLVGVICSIIGVYVYLKKISFIGAGLAHIAFAGISFGLMIGFSPMFCGFVFAFFSAVLLWSLSRKDRLTSDSTIGILFATSMGLAVFFLGLSGKYRSQALSYLFGSPLTIETVDVIFLMITALLLIFFVIYFYRDIYLTIFSEEIAKASGIPTEIITFFVTFFISVAVVSAMKAVGALLVFSLLVIPPAAAYENSNGLLKMLLLSVLFAVLSVFIGVLLSFSLDVPSGAMITIVSFLLFLLSYIKTLEN